MKIVTITCDNCTKVLKDNYIKLGSENETELCFQNKFPTKAGELISLRRHTDLHFCSKEHFFEYFFERNKTLPI